MFSLQKTFSAAIKYIGLPRVHIEIARGTAQENLEYCQKDGDFYEKGDRPLTQEEKGLLGKEAWERTITQAENGDFKAIREENPKLYFHHLRTIHYHRTCAAVKPDCLTTMDNVWLWGKAGTGKSLSARLKYESLYEKDACNKWWCGYNGEEAVLIDDLDKKDAQDFMGKYLKKWAQEAPFLAECKNGNTRYIRPKTIIVTCNWKPEEIWNNPQFLEPIARRFRVKEITGDGLPKLLERLKKRQMIASLKQQEPQGTQTLEDPKADI